MPSGVSSTSWEFEFGAGATWSPHHRYVYRHSGAIKPALGRSRSRPRHFDLSLSGSVRPALPRARPKGNGARPIGEPPCSRCRHGFARRHLCRVDHRARRRQVRAQKRRRVQRVSIRDQFPSLGPRSPVCVFGPHGPSPVSKTADLMPRRTLLLLKSGRRINLLEPLATDWDDKDLAHPLVAYRWGGHSAWDPLLSVAQCSLTVLALRRALDMQLLTDAEARRELLPDAEEGFLSGTRSRRPSPIWESRCIPCCAHLVKRSGSGVD